MQKTFDVTEPVRLDVSLAVGRIEIEATHAGQVEVILTAHDDESQKLVDQAKVELRESSGRQEVVVDVPEKRNAFGIGGWFNGRGITCQIRCPESTAVRARTKSADLAVTGTAGDVDLATASGDCRLHDVAGDLHIRSASGDVSSRAVAGRATVNTASGDVSLGPVEGVAGVNTASGDVSIDAAATDLKVNTASGDVKVDAVVSGDIGLNAVSGDVRLGVRRGTRIYLDCTTVSGSTRSELDISDDEPEGDGPFANLKVRTVSGDIVIDRAPAPAPKEVHA
jgi:DUF4097 and DUF4098 domain-containing protein YvlB